MKLGRYDDCLKELQDVLHKLEPFHPKALYRKSQVLEILGKHEEAMQVIELFY